MTADTGVDPWSLTSTEGKSVVVTGGGQGIGRMIAEGFVRAGASVYLTSRDPEKGTAVANELAEYGAVTPLFVDVSTGQGRDELVGVIRDRAGKLDVLLNNAGTTWGAPVANYPPAAFDRVWSVNVKAVFATTQALLPLLQASATEVDPARVINIGSVDGLRPPRSDNFAYSASKAGVHMLTRHLAAKLAASGVTVNAIAPGPFSSKMMSFIFDDPQAARELADNVPLKRVGEPADIAALATFLAGPGARWMTGSVITLDGGRSLA